MGVCRELILELPAHQVERWSDALLEAGALSVQAEDADAESPDEQPLFGEPGLPVAQAGWVRTRLTALLAEQADPPSVLAAAAAALDESGPLPAFELRELADRDWVSASQAQFEPIPVGARLLITPTWHLDAERARGQDAGREIIVLDPGLAFGTGSHPTTHMCLLWLSEQLHPGQSVIDYGCGSGILAIAAAKFGGTPVCGIDIDPRSSAVRARRPGTGPGGPRATGRRSDPGRIARPAGRRGCRLLSRHRADPLRVARRLDLPGRSTSLTRRRWRSPPPVRAARPVSRSCPTS